MARRCREKGDLCQDCGDRRNWNGCGRVLGHPYNVSEPSTPRALGPKVPRKTAGRIGRGSLRKAPSAVGLAVDHSRNIYGPGLSAQADDRLAAGGTTLQKKTHGRIQPTASDGVPAVQSREPLQFYCDTVMVGMSFCPNGGGCGCWYCGQREARGWTT